MASPPFQVRAIYEYSSPHDDDLSFSIGQAISVTEQEGDEWYYGEYTEQGGNKKEGLFPRNFVKIYEPEIPSRPSRLSRSKKELESSAAGNEGASTAYPATITASPLNEEPTSVDEHPQGNAAAAKGPAKSIDPSPAAPQNTAAATKPPLPSTSKPAPPPASESTAKPILGSFKDRINAFNKPAAPPVAPTKPGGLGSSSGSGFVKKPFVAPPPSKNAYVPVPREAPPQKVYHREEELEVEAQAQPLGVAEPAATPVSQPAPETADAVGDQPKPTSLKERIALLQKQQMEQAARHADAAQRKEKPKRPPKKRMESQERIADDEENIGDDLIERVDSGDTVGERSIVIPRVSADSRARPTARDLDSLETTPIASPSGPPRQFLSDGNDADISGAADTEEGEDTSTSRDEIAAKHQRLSQPSMSKSPRIAAEKPDRSNEPHSSGEEEEEEEEEDVDPEVKKRMEIRERMAKMSGGMGMAGMFGPPGGMAPMPSRRQVPSSSERKSSGDRRATGDSLTSRAPPVPMMPMPGLTRVRSPEQDELPKAEVSREVSEEVPLSVTQGRAPLDMPDVEDLKEASVIPSRRSTDRSIPPPVPHGKKCDQNSIVSLVLTIYAERPVPPPPNQARGAPPPPPRERLVPLPPSECEYLS